MVSPVGAGMYPGQRMAAGAWQPKAVTTVRARDYAILTHGKSRVVAISAIGIGASPACDGQVQAIGDIFWFSDFTPRFARRYAELGPAPEEKRIFSVSPVEKVLTPSF